MAATMGRLIEAEPARLAVDTARYAFSWLTPGRAETLEGNIARFGLLRPLLGVEEGGTVTLVAGARRLAVAELLDLDEVWVRLVESDGGSLDRPALWDLLWEDHLQNGPPNPVEVGLYLEKRMADTGETAENLARRVYERLGLPPRAGAGEDLRWVAGLPDVHKDRFATSELSMRGVRLLAEAPREDALAVLDWTKGARLSMNKFHETARWMTECAWRDGLGVDEWARKAGLDEVRGDGDALRDGVWGLRYPTLSRWTERFDEDRRGLGLPANANLAHARGFEGGRLRLTLSFGSIDELANAAREIARRAEAGEMDALEVYLG